MLKEEINTQTEIKTEIKNILRKLTHHQHIEITLRGNSAIQSSLSLVPKGSTVLIPEEGGWMGYQKIPKKRGLSIAEAACDDSKINLAGLKNKLSLVKPAVFIYQNPGGYFAEQPMKEIYNLCRKNNCLVIIDVSGSIGTKLCDGNYADILVGSFGKWKLVEAHAGGFISFRDKELFARAKHFIENLEDENSLKIIKEKLNGLPQRIEFLQHKIKKIKDDLSGFELVHPGGLGFVVVVKFAADGDRERIINYCKKNGLEWEECPRYIRLNKKAVSIEVKRLE